MFKIRVLMAPRMQPYDESMDSLNIAIREAAAQGFSISLQKVRGGAPGFQNYGTTLHNMIEAGDTHLFVTGDDVLYPSDAILRLVSMDKDVISGIYRKSVVERIEPANYFLTPEEFLSRFKEGKVYETPLAAGHSMTIKRNVIEKMILDYPELAYQQGDQTHHALFLPMIKDGICYQDDWAFSVRAKQSGFTLWDDYGCKLKHFCGAFLGFEALEVANAS